MVRFVCVGFDVRARQHGPAAVLSKRVGIRPLILDVGTGDGSIAVNIMRQRVDLAIDGVDVFNPIRFRGCSTGSFIVARLAKR